MSENTRPVCRVVFNQKGGVGKSTITCNLASIGAKQGIRTLVIDLDSQANTSSYLLSKDVLAESSVGIADFFEQVLTFSFNEKGLSDYAIKSRFENLDVIPASMKLDEIHSKLESRYKIYKLKKAIEALSDEYDMIWIDTPPALNFYTRSALIAANGCLIPFDCDEFAKNALYSLMREVKDIKEDHNENLEIDGIIVNQFQARARLPLEIVQQLKDDNLPVLEPYISSSVKIKESHQIQLPMVYMDEKHKITQEYFALFENLNSRNH